MTIPWQNFQSVIQSLLIELYPELGDEQQTNQDYQQGLELRRSLLD